MSVEIYRRYLLSEWRIIMISQTSYPIMYKMKQFDRALDKARSSGEDYITLKIPISNRILTKWQEQVRPIEGDDQQWHVVREWTEATL